MPLDNNINLPMNHVDKGWGWERWVVNCEEYCGKLLFFQQGKRCSWHFHKLKDEVFYLQSGRMMIYYSDVYRGLRHQMVALEDSELFEFSTQHFDSDSHRVLKGD